MALDLLILIVLGSILEGLVTRFSGLPLNGTPTMSISFIIVFVAVTRWNHWGLITVPFLAISTIIGGINGDVDAFRAFYNFNYCGLEVFLSTMLGLATIEINSIFFKIFGTKKIVKNTLALLGLVILDYVIYNLVQYLTFVMFVKMIGPNMFVDIKAADGTIKNTVNLWEFAIKGSLYNLFGLAVCAVLSLILRSQGVVVNVIDKLIDDKRNAELDKKDLDFRIEEVPQEQPLDEKKSDSTENGVVSIDDTEKN